jgi:hypothetical protein
VYLDSNDYSVLSDLKRETAQVVKIREELLELSESPLVTFVFSGVHTAFDLFDHGSTLSQLRN